MKAVIQRCTKASVEVEGEIVGEIENGLTVFLGVYEGDEENAAAKMAQKIAKLRVFDDAEGRFEYSLLQTNGSTLVIPNFTICGDAKKGARPNFAAAAKSENARALFERFVTLLRLQNVPVEAGIFGADMKVVVENDGPVTLILEN
jgi:D-tyrosyl-tRNA(Tyr) deacylase